ncbi:MAG: thymidylate synthase [Micromonosporaceae bacterium]|nr:thymidylate synthase [Micromonosporaceae bacterium]
MLVVTSESANDLYTAVCREILAQGRRTAPRGMTTVEVLGAHLCLNDPRRRLVDLPPVRVLNPAFAVAEALWILSGSDDPWIFTYNRNLQRYADRGRLRGAYGPRMRRWRGSVDQLDHVRRLLQQDPDSRQAIIQLYDPMVDTRGHRDVPCTLSYRFFLREGRLSMHTTMRSNDAWLGLPYDLFTATLVQELLAGWLGVELGSYHHHVDSLHLYAQHEAAAAQLATDWPLPSPAWPPVTVAADGLTEFLTALVAGIPPEGTGLAWRDMAATLASYRAWAGGDRPAARAAARAIGGVLGQALGRWYDHLSAPAPTGSTAGERR